MYNIFSRAIRASTLRFKRGIEDHRRSRTSTYIQRVVVLGCRHIVETGEYDSPLRASVILLGDH